MDKIQKNDDKRQDIIDMAETLDSHARTAYSYYLILKQYTDAQSKYPNAMDMSPAFYQIVHSALRNACFMEVAKLYDASAGALSINNLLKECTANKDLFPKYRHAETTDIDGKQYTFEIPFQRRLTPEEEAVWRKTSTEQQQKIADSQRKILSIFSAENEENISVSLDLSFEEFLDLNNILLNSMSKKLENIRIQRNKIYAHNDRNTEKAEHDHMVFYQDIERLIDFAFDFVELILSIFTDEPLSRTYSNIGDWENTLEFTSLGLEYQHIKNEERQNAYMDDFHKQLNN